MEAAAENLSVLRERFDRGDPAALLAIKREAAKHKFYHSIEVVPGFVTPGLSANGPGWAWADEIVGRIIGALGTLGLRGKRVLDIGCRDGAMSFAAEDRGAAEVVAIDNNLSVAMTDFLVPLRRSRVKVEQCNVNDLSRELFGEFDVILFPGVLYHLRYLVWALRRIVDVLKSGGVLLIESAFLDGMEDFPIMFCPVGTDSIYEPTSVTFFNEPGITATLLSLGLADIRCLGSFTPSALWSRRNIFRASATKFPRFFLSQWWRRPLQVRRKIFTCVKRWSEDPRLQYAGPYDQRGILAKYWDGSRWLQS
jgi:2-polyprenyl-3-methyl-5-hydroxy-6-metoxy-1,4-benzoquinol methylase